MNHWLNMGGYAFYIWTAYLIAVCVVLGLIYHVHRTLKQVKLKLKSLHASSS